MSTVCKRMLIAVIATTLMGTPVAGLPSRSAMRNISSLTAKANAGRRGRPR